MFLEGQETLVLEFTINKDLTLRRLMSDPEFRELILTAVRLYRDQNPELCVLLLDKVKESKLCLELMIELQFNHLLKMRPESFLSLTEMKPSLTEDHVFDEQEMRIKKQFAGILANMEKEKVLLQNRDLTAVLNQLDVVAGVYIALSCPSKLTE